jgi:hypothetical protein
MKVLEINATRIELTNTIEIMKHKSIIITLAIILSLVAWIIYEGLIYEKEPLTFWQLWYEMA